MEDMEDLTIAFCWLDQRAADDLELPRYASEYAAGMDIRAAVDAPLTLHVGQRALVQTGLAVAIPRGYEMQVRPRSGLAVKHGITVLNSPGTIDADYRGEIKVALVNLGDAPFTLYRGDRMAQLVVSPVVRGRIQRVARLDDTARGGGGFGHTGR